MANLIFIIVTWILYGAFFGFLGEYVFIEKGKRNYRDACISGIFWGYITFLVVFLLSCYILVKGIFDEAKK